jgi:hypothetical protein
MDIAPRRTARNVRACSFTRLTAPTVRKFDKIGDPDPIVETEGIVHLPSKTVELSQETESRGSWSSSISQPRRATLCRRQKHGAERGRHQALEPVR